MTNSPNTSPGPLHMNPGEGMPNTHSQIDPTLTTDPFIKVFEKYDPYGYIDPHHELLDDCAREVQMYRELYKGTVEFPPTYIADMYAHELQYVSRGMNSLRELLRMNEEAGTPVTEIDMLFDLDNSQVAVVDLPNEVPGTAAGDDEAFPHDSEKSHVPRVGWKFLVHKMITEELAPRGIWPRLGAISDRPQNFNAEQTVSSSGADLKQIVVEQFKAAGLYQYLDPQLIISSSDGELAQTLPEYLRSGMRGPVRYDEEGRPVRLSRREREVIRAEQLEAIAAISSPDRLANPDLEYHDKVGVVFALARQAEAGKVIMWWDDIRSTELVHSPQAMGVYVPLHEMAPLLPNDIFRYG